MAVTLDGGTLGEKHKHYNKLLKEAIGNESVESAETEEENDVKNFLKIDTACHKKDVKYIMKVLESDDMLYVSRAIKRSTWLITEQQYAHIINSEYLRTQLFPRMNTKAINKLLQHIRLNLQDEVRFEQFYQSEKSPEKALKWLPYCSAEFIEKNIEKHIDKLTTQLFKRLCEKSFRVFEIVMMQTASQSFLDVSKFLMFSNIEKYLDVIEQLPHYVSLQLGARATDSLMKICPDRIINKFEYYVYIDMPTFAKHIKKENIKDFLFMQAGKKFPHHFRNLNSFFHSNRIIHLINRIPQTERFAFVKQVFIDKVDSTQDTTNANSELLRVEELQRAVILKKYIWYQFAPFELAFAEIKTLLQSEPSREEKWLMLKVLIICAVENKKHLHSLLQYFNVNHKNDDMLYKSQFMRCVISRVDIHLYDQELWNITNEVFQNMNVYVDSGDDVQKCLEFIIVYKILQNAEVPEIVENKFSFDTLKPYYIKLKQNEKDKVFNFLYNHLLTKIQKQNVTNETEFKEVTKLINKILALLVDGNKDIVDYPFVLDKIKDLIKINNENSWKIDLSSIYNVKKSWRKHMFEESLLLSPSEEVCMNALKHDPGLLVRHRKEVEAMCNKDSISLQRLLSKLRIYWPHIATEWSDAYLGRLSTLGHEAVIRGLCALLPPKALLDIIKTYAPNESKIDWGKIDELTLSLQRHIAKKMHLARPQPTPDAVLWYAKGDYLQYALPSLLSIFYNLNTNVTREHIPKLLNAPVSLQKHGIRFAVIKLAPEELKSLFLDIWKTSKNVSIRCEIFKFTFHILSKESDAKRIEDFWKLLELFIDNLTFEEDKKIYDLLLKVDDIPQIVRAKFLMKSYNFFKRLIPHLTGEHDQYKWGLNSLAEGCRFLMDSLCPEFVSEIIEEFINDHFFNFENEYHSHINSTDGMLLVVTAYLLSAKDVETQTERYQKILLPLMQRSFNMWDETHDGKYCIRHNVRELFEALRDDLRCYVIKNNQIIPYKMFCDIQNEIKILSVPENYVMLTTWKITTAMANLLQKCNATGEWSDVSLQLSPELEEICLAALKDDVKTYFPCIYEIFSEALQKIITNLPDQLQLRVFKHMVSDKDFVQAYLVTIKLFPRYFNLKEDETEAIQLKNLISAHPSVEVKMHYFNKFDKERNNIIYVGC